LAFTRVAILATPSCCSGAKAVAKHRWPALGCGFSRFVLQDIPALSETAIFDPHDIGGDPVPRPSNAWEPAMDDNKILAGENDTGFLFQRRWPALDQVESAMRALCLI
jgi:hypothetical protein